MGKTSLCKALAQKLSIHLNDRYKKCLFVEINSHSLFSKWFSEVHFDFAFIFMTFLTFIVLFRFHSTS